jgi:hypothetical protein
MSKIAVNVNGWRALSHAETKLVLATCLFHVAALPGLYGVPHGQGSRILPS